MINFNTEKYRKMSNEILFEITEWFSAIGFIFAVMAVVLGFMFYIDYCSQYVHFERIFPTIPKNVLTKIILNCMIQWICEMYGTRNKPIGYSHYDEISIEIRKYFFERRRGFKIFLMALSRNETENNPIQNFRNNKLYDNNVIREIISFLIRTKMK